jgi:endonuclease G
MVDFQQRYKEKARACQEKAEERFRLRESARAEIRNKIKEKGPLGAESIERVNAREAMIKAVIGRPDGIAHERIIGSSDLLEINYLDLGMKASRSVCRIQVRDENGRVLGFGTGFLVSPVLLLTNNHVLDRIESSRRSLADFNFEDDINFIPKDTKTFPLDPDRFFYTSEELDFTIVAIRPQSTDGSPLSGFGFLRLNRESGKALLGEYVTIIQHPDGASKQITVRENEVVDLPERFIHYHTDTKPGSSGSPVFNDQWQVVALHHAGVQKRDSQGRVLSIDGSVWDPNTMDEDKIAWVANEGIRISSICQDMQNKMNTWTLEQQDLVNGVFSGTAPITSPEPSPIEVKEQPMEWYASSTGYDPDFLGQNIPLPIIPDASKEDVVPLKQGNDYELKYTHFSAVMSKSRRLALFTAVNIDGDKLVNLRRSRDRWYFDPRIDHKYQSDPELYERNDLDRGHLVRRLDPTWGDNAEEANEDTFHFTNCSPQHKALNQQTWQNLEDYILKNAGLYSLKVVVFTGPVFRDDDMLYRGKFQIPAEYWKVVAIVKEDGKLSATAYLQTQKNLIEDLEFAYGKYKTYQVPIAKIEALTKLNFGDLRNQDPLANIEGTLGRIITAPNDIRL